MVKQISRYQDSMGEEGKKLCSASPLVIRCHRATRSRSFWIGPYDPATGTPTTMLFLQLKYTSPGCSNASSVWRTAYVDPTTLQATAPHVTHPSAFYGYYVTGMNGNLYHLNKNTNRLQRFDSSTRTWTTFAGTGDKGNCADGTVATSCKMDPSDMFVTINGKVFYTDRGRIRTIDENGQIKTVFGQGYSYGDGDLATSARFNSISALGVHTNGGDQVVAFDLNEIRMREFSIGGNIATIAGNGDMATPDQGVPAATQPIRHDSYSTSLAVDATSGDVYFTRGASRIAKLNRGTGQWSDMVGNGSGTPYQSADTLTGNNIKLSSYPALILGANAGKIVASLFSYDGVLFKVVDAFVKTYSISDGTQNHLLGKTGDPAALCPAGTLMTNCTIPANSSFANFVHDAGQGRWLFALRNTSRIMSIPDTGNGTVTDLIASVGRNINSLAYKTISPTSHKIFYCGVNGRIYEWDLDAPGEVALPWSVGTMKCAGYTLIYSASRNSLVFPFTQNGLYGVAEYLLGP